MLSGASLSVYEEFFILAVTVAIVSITGIVSPGPLVATNIAYGVRGGMKSGLKMAIGHTIVEAPTVAILGLGIISFADIPWISGAISGAGAVGLFAFSYMQSRSILRKTVFNRTAAGSPLMAGIVMSACNPFFILWWTTIGLNLIADVTHQWGLVGIPIMFAMHIWIDYAWMMFIGGMSGKMSRFISNKMYKIIILGTSAVMAYFGIVFTLDAISYFGS